MSKKRNVIAMVVSVGLVAVIGVGATLAYLTDSTDVLTNTFTVGNNIDIDLLETKWKTEDKKEVGEDFKGNAYTDLLPGDWVKKDPNVRVNANSTDCYVFIKVDNIDELENVDTNNDGVGDFTVTGFVEANWELINPAEGGVKDGIYCYVGPKAVDSVISKQDGDVMLEDLFTTVTYEMAANGIVPEGEVLPSITVRACAVQAGNLTIEKALKAAIWK